MCFGYEMHVGHYRCIYLHRGKCFCKQGIKQHIRNKKLLRCTIKIETFFTFISKCNKFKKTYRKKSIQLALNGCLP